MRNAKQTVFFIDKDRALERPVKTGEALGEMTEIKEGLKPGDKVVLHPPERLNTGAKIRIAEK
jgi:multidrug efflux pump subunit AcrA (membrane-fusion protein)